MEDCSCANVNFNGSSSNFIDHLDKLMISKAMKGLVNNTDFDINKDGVFNLSDMDCWFNQAFRYTPFNYVNETCDGFDNNCDGFVDEGVCGVFLEEIGNKSVYEGDNLEIDLNAIGYNDSEVNFSASGLPAGSSLVLDIFNWTPDYFDNGTYYVNFSVEYNGYNDSEVVEIVVLNLNRAPVLDEIGNKSVDESNTLNFIVNASDLDNDSLDYGVSSLPIGATFDNFTRTFNWVTDYSDAGNYSMNFSVSDGTDIDYEKILIIVNDVNRAPVLDVIGAQSIDENSTLEIIVNASDDDNDVLYYDAINVPSGATFDNVTRTFSWNTNFSNSGSYNVNFSVTDQEDVDYEIVTITVNNVNRAPVLDAIGSQLVDENESLSFNVSATDLDNDSLVFDLSGDTGSYNYNNDTGEFSWTPLFNESGSYTLNFSVSDGTDNDYEVVIISVNNVNRVPTFNESLTDYVINENSSLVIDVNGSDPDMDMIDYDYFISPVLNDASISDTGLFNLNASFDDAGSYTIIFFINDSESVVNQSIQLNITNVNRVPVFSLVENNSPVIENQTLQLNLSATDDDGDLLIYNVNDSLIRQNCDNYKMKIFDVLNYKGYSITVNSISSSAVALDVNGDSGTVIEDDTDILGGLSVGVFDIEYSSNSSHRNVTLLFDCGSKVKFEWVTDYADAGSYNISYNVTDGEDYDIGSVLLEVTNNNRGPVLENVSDVSITAYNLINITLNGTDADNDSLSYLTDFGYGSLNTSTGNYLWTPTNDEIGNHTIEFVVSDGELNDSISVDVEVLAAGDAMSIEFAFEEVSTDGNNNTEMCDYISCLNNTVMTFYNQDYIVFNVTTNVSASRCYAELDELDHPYSNYSFLQNMTKFNSTLFTINMTGLEDGQYILNVTCMDDTGFNRTTSKNIWEVNHTVSNPDLNYTWIYRDDYEYIYIETEDIYSINMTDFIFTLNDYSDPNYTEDWFFVNFTINGLKSYFNDTSEDNDTFWHLDFDFKTSNETIDSVDHYVNDSLYVYSQDCFISTISNDSNNVFCRIEAPYSWAHPKYNSSSELMMPDYMHIIPTIRLDVGDRTIDFADDFTVREPVIDHNFTLFEFKNIDPTKYNGSSRHTLYDGDLVRFRFNVTNIGEVAQYFKIRLFNNAYFVDNNDYNDTIVFLDLNESYYYEENITIEANCTAAGVNKTLLCPDHDGERKYGKHVAIYGENHSYDTEGTGIYGKDIGTDTKYAYTIKDHLNIVYKGYNGTDGNIYMRVETWLNTDNIEYSFSTYTFTWINYNITWELDTSEYDYGSLVINNTNSYPNTNIDYSGYSDLINYDCGNSTSCFIPALRRSGSGTYQHYWNFKATSCDTIPTQASAYYFNLTAGNHPHDLIKRSVYQIDDCTGEGW